ncbi:hypothetical protein [Kitasatospora sp. NPDC088779]|uniref:hypothetical protein n=1 Tax=unclassified Kitasatospora TaxID=2633591 RepID=UPI0034169073
MYPHVPVVPREGTASATSSKQDAEIAFAALEQGWALHASGPLTFHEVHRLPARLTVAGRAA